MQVGSSTTSAGTMQIDYEVAVVNHGRGAALHARMAVSSESSVLRLRRGFDAQPPGASEETNPARVIRQPVGTDDAIGHNLDRKLWITCPSLPVGDPLVADIEVSCERMRPRRFRLSLAPNGPQGWRGMVERS